MEDDDYHDFELTNTAAVSQSSQSSQQGEDVVQFEFDYFFADDDEHRYLRKRCEMLCAIYNNQALTASMEERAKAWNDLVDPKQPDGVEACAPHVKSPITIDYGIQVHISPSVFIHRGCYIADSPYAPISIGEDTIIGPDVKIFGIKHDADWGHRSVMYGPTWAAPVRIGKHCLIGANVVIMPGLDIGNGCVIGANSVVTRSIPAYHVAYGNPARPIRKVALDAPDAPGMQYERRGDRILVSKLHEEAYTDRAMSEMTVTPNSDGLRGEAAQLAPDSGKNGFVDKQRQTLPASHAAVRRDATSDAVVLLLALVGAWLIVHIICYWSSLTAARTPNKACCRLLTAFPDGQFESQIVW